ncbi:MAG: M3 family oligoendopeptidase [Flammeovirgaceae bacterium]|nr:M3 family oligoendopeptidase [Flammeovirgaceae bacterium]
MIEEIVRPKRNYIPEDFNVTTWEGIKPFYDELMNRSVSSEEELKRWFQDRSELESIISEDLGWRYIRMTIDTENEEYSKSYKDFIENIQPKISPLADQLNRKALEIPYLKSLLTDQGFEILIRNLRKEIEIYREKNIELFTQINTETQRFAQISGAMTVTVDDKELTLQQAAVILMSTDRERREIVYRKISERRLQDKQVLDQLFNKLITLRHQVAQNADFINFRDYMFKAYGRFDYTPDDCFKFHDSIAWEVVPIVNEVAQRRKKKLGVDRLRPWDKAVDEEGREPLTAFDGGKDLTQKGIEVFSKLDPYLGQCLSTMNAMGHLDLESRKGKAPGGYNYPLAEIGVPFIFMNATSTMRDMTTLMHEGGHAVHNFLTRDLELGDFKSPPMEVAELASMAMELISMDHWDVFFHDTENLKRAKIEQLEDVLETLPWIATIDKFQHWIYENPTHTSDDRIKNWNLILNQFSDSITDWSGLEEAKNYLWQKQLHLYEVPFYYIEYGMAQLGAIAIWRKYRLNKKEGLAGYKAALTLGNTRTIPEIFEAAGIKFDFSRTYIRELIAFVKSELNDLG